MREEEDTMVELGSRREGLYTGRAIPTQPAPPRGNFVECGEESFFGYAPGTVKGVAPMSGAAEKGRELAMVNI
ncbi:unnamed protein product [Linum tenue]|uniref:Uncharacterized protein n=1 Tax=Linum tenue TaxID=586396 RepID=A0AAV0IYH5_9ROSI|nr:unnamed protein product [Linum tenue]